MHRDLPVGISVALMARDIMGSQLNNGVQTADMKKGNNMYIEIHFLAQPVGTYMIVCE